MSEDNEIRTQEPLPDPEDIDIDIENKKSIPAKVVEVIIDKIGGYFFDFNEARNNRIIKEHSINKELELEELKALDKIDRRDKNFKLLIIIICLASLAAITIFQKAQSLIPVLSLILGLSFKVNSLADFIKFRISKINNKEEE